MPKRKIDPITGEPELTHREQMLIDEFIKNGGNGSRAAAAAGYGAARLDQSAYQVLRRPEVQRRIRNHIAESRVSADEIIGTLASFMRGCLAEFLDESGQFSIELAKEKGIDHLLKSITITTREIDATTSKPAQVVRTCLAQLHSPVQAAIILARIFGILRKNARAKNPQLPDTSVFEPQRLERDNFQSDFDPLVWLDHLIRDQMRQTGLPRQTVVNNLLQIRPEIAGYLNDLEPADAPYPFVVPPSGGSCLQALTTESELVPAASANLHPAAFSSLSVMDLHADAHQPIQDLASERPSTTPGSEKSHSLPMFPSAPRLTQAPIPALQPPAPQAHGIPTQDSAPGILESLFLPMFRRSLPPTPPP